MLMFMFTVGITEVSSVIWWEICGKKRW